MSLGLNLENVSEQGTPVPDGSYNVAVEKAEVKDTRTGGKLIAVQFSVLDGPHANRKVFTQYNMENANAQAVQIGLGQLKGMMKAFGHKNPNRLESTDELVGLKGVIRVKVEEDPGYGPQARVKSYAPLAGSGPVTGAAAGANGAAPAQAASGGGNPFA